MNQRAYVTDDGQKLVLPSGHAGRIGIGGQGQVYRLQLGGQPIAIKLCRQIEEARLIALQRLEPTCGTIATLPRQRLYHYREGKLGPLAGYAMRCVESQRSVSAARLFNFQEIGNLKHFTWRDAVGAALRLAESVEQLHRHGVVIGDLNPENVLFEQQGQGEREPSTSWQAVILDSDSFQITTSAEHFHCPVSRAPYTAPELIDANLATTWRDASSDAFSLAVIVYQLLLHDHPYDNALLQAEPELEVTSRIRRGLYPHAAMRATGLRPGPYRPAPAAISDDIDAAFRRSFCCEPALRPTAAEWVLLLGKLHRQVVPCSRNSRHQHPRDQSCLWCAVERRIGQPICRYSSAQPSTQARLQKAEQAEEGLQAAAPEQLVEQLALARDLVERRAMLIEQLQQLQAVMHEIAGRCSTPDQLVDEQAVLARLGGLRNRLSRWLGQQQQVAARRQHADTLIALAHDTTAMTQQQCQQLEGERQGLMQRLANSNTAELASSLPLQDPNRGAALLWEQALERQQQQWLRERLAQQSLRSWQIDGFGEGRMALLERHGLERGDQLLAMTDQLNALPGIGRVLQQRLRLRLRAEVEKLQGEQHQLPPALPQKDASKLALGETALARIRHHRELIEALQADAAALAIATRELNQEINARVTQRDALLQTYTSLF